MGIASLILGIISLVTGWIPFVCFLVLILAIIGLVLGIIDTLKKSKIQKANKGISIAGLVVSALAIPVIIISSILSFFMLSIGMPFFREKLHNNYGVYKYNLDKELHKNYNCLNNLNYYNQLNEK